MLLLFHSFLFCIDNKVFLFMKSPAQIQYFFSQNYISTTLYSMKSRTYFYPLKCSTPLSIRKQHNLFFYTSTLIWFYTLVRPAVTYARRWYFLLIFFLSFVRIPSNICIEWKAKQSNNFRHRCWHAKFNIEKLFKP